jgi:choline-sulfatase
VLEVVGEDTIVVVVADHGDLLGEHELWGHMTSLYEPLVNVPFVMAGPRLPQGLNVTDPVSFVDVLPTLIDAIDIVPPESDGRSLLPLLRGEESFPDRELQAEHFRTDRATRLWAGNVDPIRMPWIKARRGATITSRLKRVISEDGIDAGYDLSRDPEEVRPFPGEQTGLEAAVPVPPVIEDSGMADEMDAAQREALRALGYVQ